MRVFDKDGKINFVDENNVYLGYDTNQDCCEDAGWFISDTKQKSILDSKETELPELTEFRFDESFSEYVDGPDFDCGGMVIFRITNGSVEKFVHIFNAHNGYYCHGFVFEIDGVKIQSGII